METMAIKTKYTHHFASNVGNFVGFKLVFFFSLVRSFVLFLSFSALARTSVITADMKMKR